MPIVKWADGDADFRSPKDQFVCLIRTDPPPDLCTHFSQSQIPRNSQEHGLSLSTKLGAAEFLSRIKPAS